MAYQIRLTAGTQKVASRREVEITVTAKVTDVVRRQNRRGVDTFPAQGRVTFEHEATGDSESEHTDALGRAQHKFLVPMRNREYTAEFKATFVDEDGARPVEADPVRVRIPSPHVTLAVSTDGLYDGDPDSFYVTVSVAEEGRSKQGHQGAITVEGIGSRTFETLTDGTSRRKFKLPEMFPHTELSIRARDAFGNQSDLLKVTLPEKRRKKPDLEVDAEVYENRRQPGQFRTRLFTRKNGERTDRTVYVYSSVDITIRDLESPDDVLIDSSRNGTIEVTGGLRKILVILPEDQIQAKTRFCLEDEDDETVVIVRYVKYRDLEEPEGADS